MALRTLESIRMPIWQVPIGADGAQNSPDLRSSLRSSQGVQKRPAIIRQRYDMIQNRRGTVTPDPKACLVACDVGHASLASCLFADDILLRWWQRPSVVPSLQLEKIVPSDDSEDDYEEPQKLAPVQKVLSPPLPPQRRHA